MGNESCTPGGPRGGAPAGVRVAFVGSGGSGKSVIAGTLARLLARRDRRVLAIDLDPNPGLCFSLGLGPIGGGLDPDLLAPADGQPYGWDLAPGIDPAAVVVDASRAAPDGVRYLSPGTIDGPDHQVGRSLTAVRRIADAAGPEWDVIGDLEAGTTTPYEGYARFAERVAVVVAPSWRSALAARRVLALLERTDTMVVASRWRDEVHHRRLRPAVVVPHDASVRRAERDGRAPLDDAPDCPAIEAIRCLAEVLEVTR